MRPNNSEIQQEIERRRASDIGYRLLTDEEIAKEIQDEKKPPVKKSLPKPKPKKKKRRRASYRISPYPFNNG